MPRGWMPALPGMDNFPGTPPITPPQQSVPQQPSYGGYLPQPSQGLKPIDYGLLSQANPSMFQMDPEDEKRLKQQEAWGRIASVMALMGGDQGQAQIGQQLAQEARGRIDTERQMRQLAYVGAAQLQREAQERAFEEQKFKHQQMNDLLGHYSLMVRESRGGANIEDVIGAMRATLAGEQMPEAFLQARFDPGGRAEDVQYGKEIGEERGLQEVAPYRERRLGREKAAEAYGSAAGRVGAEYENRERLAEIERVKAEARSQFSGSRSGKPDPFVDRFYRESNKRYNDMATKMALSNPEYFTTDDPAAIWAKSYDDAKRVLAPLRAEESKAGIQALFDRVRIDPNMKASFGSRFSAFLENVPPEEQADLILRARDVVSSVGGMPEVQSWLEEIAQSLQHGRQGSP